MAGSEFSEDIVPGQRWISNTESELGLGIVESTADRRLVISFPAAAEKRTYALDNAPLSRVIYEVGETVSTLDGLEIGITARDQRDGRIIYVGTGPLGEETRVDELELDAFVQFSKPQDRLFAGQVDRNSRFALRVETLDRAHRHQRSPARGLLGARVQLLPHQLYIASRVAERHAPRVLLADEVGLGKTIESGLILHHQLVTGQASRILVVVPASLVHQWLVEMIRRFNLGFTILDEARCAELESSGEDNPFETAQLVICALAFLQEAGLRRAQAQAAGWDLLVLDEAHHLSWHEDGASDAYRCVEALAADVPGLLLLTATPQQLGVEGHFARLRLLDPARFPSLVAFRAAESRWRDLGGLVAAVLAARGEAPPGPAHTGHPAQLDRESMLAGVARLLGEDSAADLARALSADPAEHPAAVEAVVDRLLDCHGTGRVLFRNTRRQVGGFPGRRLHAHPLAPPPGAFAPPSAGTGAAQLLDPRLRFGEQWCRSDPRVGWLADFCRGHRREKVVVIAARSSTAETLEEFLRTRGGLRSAVFHEAMTLLARDRAAAYFAEAEDAAAQVLVCSEIGSEGRNFQTAHHLVLFDLPVVPDLLEQRIGRLDRIGQREVVEIHVPYLTGTAQEVLLRWYRDGLDAFERSFAAGDLIHAAFSDQLLACLERPADEGAVATLIEQTRAAAATALAELEAGRDWLIELNSNRPRRGAEVVAAVSAASSELELTDYMERLFDELGVEQERHSARTVVLRASERMTADHFSGLSEEGLSATFHRNEALSREDLAFLTWEHPMVREAMDLVLHGHFGNTAFCTLKLPSVGPGLLVLEAIFVLHCAAPRWLQLGRFMAQAMVRVVTDREGNDLSRAFPPAQFNRLAQRVPTGRAREFIRHVRADIAALVRRSETLAEVHRQSLIESAVVTAREFHRRELQRLEDLARNNPLVRSDEIERAAEGGRLAVQHLEDARLRLDAVRVAVTT